MEKFIFLEATFFKHFSIIFEFLKLVLMSFGQFWFFGRFWENQDQMATLADPRWRPFENMTLSLRLTSGL